MQKQKCSLALYSSFLIGNHNRYSGVECSKVTDGIAHDAVSRWLSAFIFRPQELWNQMNSQNCNTAAINMGWSTVLI